MCVYDNTIYNIQLYNVAAIYMWGKFGQRVVAGI